MAKHSNQSEHIIAGDNNLYETLLFSFGKLHSMFCLRCLFIYRVEAVTNQQQIYTMT